MFTRKFLELQECIRETDEFGTAVANTLKIYQGSTADFDWKNPSLTGTTQVVNGGVSFEHLSVSSKITITGSLTVGRAYYITDSNNNILLAVKGTNIFYLNVLLSRDYNIYDTDGDVVGSI